MVARAREAQPIWEAIGFEGRAEVLLAARRWMVANAERVVTTIVGETGRPADETQFAELAYGLSALEFWAKTAPGYLADEEIQSASPFVRGRKLVVRYAPLGVIGVIGPWNYPLINSFGDCIPALAAGNAVVLKPSEVTPLTSLLMAEMLAECGIPEGVFQVATGRGETGAALVREVDMVMFTGSVKTGKRVLKRAAKTLTPVSLELGGNDPMIVLADADLERAANAAVSYGMNNAGQVCISVERVYVEDPVYDEFLERVTGKVEALRQGAPGAAGSVDVGAIIFPPQLELIEAHVRDAVSKGAKVVTGGKRAESLAGRFFEPTVLADVDHSMRCMNEETFGPTLPVMRVGDAKEAVRLANDGPYGLQASVWTRDTEKGERLARRVEAGVCCVNDAQLNYGALELPMGGWKASGMGSRHGPDGIRKYAKRQSLLITPGYAPSRELHMYPYSAEVTEQVGAAISALATSEVFTDAQRRTLLAFCDTLIPSLPPPQGADGVGDPHGFWARAASHLGVPEAVEIALLQSGAPEEQLAGLAALLDSLAEQGMVAEAPQEAREQLDPRAVRLRPRGARRDPHAAGADAVAVLRAPRPRHRPEPQLGRDRISGAAAPAARRAEAARRPPARAGGRRDDDRGRRVRGGLRRGRRRDRGDPGRRRQAGLRARAGRLLQRGRLQPAGGLGLPEPLPARRADPDGRGPGLDPGRLVARRRHRDQLAELPADVPLGARGVGARARARGRRRARLRPLPRPGDGADRRHRLVLGAERAAPAPQGGLRRAGLGLQADHPQRRPGQTRPRSGRLRRLRRRDRLQALGPEDLPGRRRASTAPTWSSTAAPSGSWSRMGARRGSRATYAGPNGATARVVVRAPQVVVACGSIESPALLRRSGIGGPAVGDYLRLHPAGAMFATYDEPQDSWWGPPQSALSHQFAEGSDGHGFLLEGAHHAIGIIAAAVPWESGRQHKEEIARFKTTSGLILLIRDRGHGRVDVDEAGNAVPSYRLADDLDVANFRAGLEAVARVHEAAGAERIIGPEPQAARVDPGRGLRRLPRPASRLLAGSARARRLLRPPDGKLPDGRRPGDVGRQPVGRAARHARRLDRGRERLPHRLGHQPDGHDHGPGAPHRRGDRRGLTARPPFSPGREWLRYAADQLVRRRSVTFRAPSGAPSLANRPAIADETVI